MQGYPCMVVLCEGIFYAVNHLRGMRTALGFPENRTVEYIEKALERGYSAALLAEAGPGKWIRHRYVTRMWLRCEDQGVQPDGADDNPSKINMRRTECSAG